MIVEICSGPNGAPQSTNCTSNFSAGNTVAYYPLPGGPNGQGLGLVPFATTLTTTSTAIAIPLLIVQDKYQITGCFTTNQTCASTGIGHGGSTGSAKEYQTTGSSALGKNFVYTLQSYNTYTSTTFPYEAGFVSSSQADVNNKTLNLFLECAETKTGGTAGDAPTITGFPQVASTGNGVTGGGTIYYAAQISDVQTQKIAQSSYSSLISSGTATFTLNINQAALASGDTFALTCYLYAWFNLPWFESWNGQLNAEAAAMTASFTLTMTY